MGGCWDRVVNNQEIRDWNESVASKHAMDGQEFRDQGIKNQIASRQCSSGWNVDMNLERLVVSRWVKIVWEFNATTLQPYYRSEETKASTSISERRSRR